MVIRLWFRGVGVVAWSCCFGVLLFRFGGVFWIGRDFWAFWVGLVWLIWCRCVGQVVASSGFAAATVIWFVAIWLCCVVGGLLRL